MLYSFIFFFKQKTAYEMRISDWSSDVCSSDLSEMNGVYAHQVDQWHHHRNDQNNGRRRMQEHAQKQEQHIEQRQHHPLVGREITDRLGQRLWRLDLGQIGAQIGRASCRERVCQYV